MLCFEWAVSYLFFVVYDGFVSLGAAPSSVMLLGCLDVVQHLLQCGCAESSLCAHQDRDNQQSGNSEISFTT